jgi:hypothetical protein
MEMSHERRTIMTNLNDLAWIAARNGLAAAELPLARTVRQLRHDGFSSVALDVLSDSAEPEVARLRALSLVQRQLARQVAAPPARGTRSVA